MSGTLLQRLRRRAMRGFLHMKMQPGFLNRNRNGSAGTHDQVPEYKKGLYLTVQPA